MSVRQMVSLRADHLSVRVGQAVRLAGRVSPGRTGTVTLQRRRLTATRWSPVGQGALDSHGRHRLVGLTRTGRDFAWRVVAAKAGGLGRGVSCTLIVQVG